MGDKRIVRGICYGNDAFPKPYDPSTANQIQMFFGSDNTAPYCGALWGEEYRAANGDGCKDASCRDDLALMKDMGVQVVRLYDWDPRNSHREFLKTCDDKGIKVLASVSNYFVQHRIDVNFEQLIGSFTALNREYHPAIAGIVFGNELENMNDYIAFTKMWVDAERKCISERSTLPIGHPVNFAKNGNDREPCWHYWEALVPGVGEILGSRLFLAPQTYNDAEFLFGDGGWVDSTWKKFGIPIWFTEIGQDRKKKDYQKIVKDQLTMGIKYAESYSDRLLGCCFFSFADKVWMPDTSEGSFGAFTHGTDIRCKITFTGKDFTHHDCGDNFGVLCVDQLIETDLGGIVKSVFHA